MKVARALGGTILSGMLALAGGALAYESVPVDNGGAILGSVTVKGPAPAPASIPVTKNPETCGSSKLAEDLIVGKTGGLKNAVVYLRDIQKGKAIVATAPVLNQRKCVYEPHVQAVAKSTNLIVRNGDPVMHNVHATMVDGRLVFNIGMPGDQDVPKKLRREGLAVVICDAGHTWMKAYIYIFEHPYFAVTGEDGAFRLDAVPPGTYELVVWHEMLGERVQSVTVAAGANTKATVQFSK